MSAGRPILVVTPTLGRSPWLAATVASVAGALGTRAAHVLVAPGDEADRLRRVYPQCAVIGDTVRRGVYPAINLGLVHAPDPNWEWFTWINDDDMFLPGFARHADRALQFGGRRPDAPWMYGPVRLGNAEGDDLGRLAIARCPGDIVGLAQSGINPLNQQGLLVPRVWVERLGPIREDLRICADVDFWLRAAVAGAPFRRSAEDLALFRLRRGQISGDEGRHRQEFAEVVTQLTGAPRRSASLALARLRFRLGNLAVYFDRVRRCGWKGGFALLADPVRRPT